MIRLSCPLIGEEEEKAVVDVLRSRNLVQGKLVQEFEEQFADFIGAKYTIAVSSGTAALHLALLAHQIGRQDEVITSPFSFVATANTIALTGATPAFADIDPVTFNIAPQNIKITERTRAIVPVHLYGLSANMDVIRDIAIENDLAVIEDACQAFGASVNGSYVGSSGTACFSLYATKNITTGEGGTIATDEREIYDKCRLLRSHGLGSSNILEAIGYNYRMTEIQAAIGLCQLKKAKYLLERRREVASRYLDSISTHKVLLPFEPPEYGHAFHLFTVRVPQKRDRAIASLAKNGIETRVYYDPPLNKQPMFSSYCEDMPVAEKAAKEVLSIPVHPGLTDGEVDKITEVVNSI